MSKFTRTRKSKWFGALAVAAPVAAPVALPVALTILFLVGCHNGDADHPNPGGTAAVKPVPPSPPPEPPFGLATRPAWLTSRITGSPEAPPPFRTVRAFPNLTFDNPVDIAFTPDGSRAFVVGQHAKIYSFPWREDVTKADLLLDLNTLRDLDKVPNCKGAGDTYGIALHPKFNENHYCYVCYLLDYTTRVRNHENGSRLSRFTIKPGQDPRDPPTIDPASEVIVLQWLGGGHNGGCVKFGPDGMLYLSTGDGADPNPPDSMNTGQDVSDLLASILRIDVDHPTGDRQYSIPPDNPFVHTEGARGEVWAYGLRNPWRMSFDRATGNLWVGDVGWELWESVVCAQAGGNYGWSIMEGPNPVHLTGKVGPTPIVPPQAALPHTESASVSGGVVYRGSKFLELVGQYVWGDWQTQRLWAAKCIGEHQDRLEPYRMIAQTDQKVVAFGEQPDGEPIILDHGGGGLWRLERNDSNFRPEDFPHKLSDTGLFISTLDQSPEQGVLFFEINAHQWADGASTKHWIAVPGAESVRWGKGVWGDDTPAWPKDSVLVRTLSLPASLGDPSAQKPVETQILHFDGRQWQGYSYAWNEQGTDAELVKSEGDSRTVAVPDASATMGVRRQTWQYPSRAQCITCHSNWVNYTLAFYDAQLDRTHDFSDVGGTKDNQVRTFRHLGLLLAPKPPKKGEKPDPTDNPVLTDPYDASADLYERARSYLHVNCSHCHRFGAGGSALFDVRKELPLDKTKTVNVKPSLGDLGLPDARILYAGDPARSVMLYRMSKLGRERMPHIISERVDDRGVELIRQWVISLGKNAPASGPSSAPAAQVEALHALEDPSTPEPAATAAADRLLSTTGGALALLFEVENGKLPAAHQQIVVAHGAGSNLDLVRDLYRRFDPADQNVERLGPNINPQRILSKTGDAGRGRKVFFEIAGTGLCAKCHKVGGQGTDFGPDLSHIATKYNRPDLLDNILNPSKTIAQGYNTYLVKTKSGETYTGLLVSKTDQEVVLKDATLQQTRVPAADVEKVVQQPTSAMPEGLLRDLDAQQAADLLEYVASLK